MSERRIGNVAAFFLTFCAVVFDSASPLVDLLAFVPVVGFVLAFMFERVVSIVATLFFAIAFSHLGVSAMKKRPLGFIGTIVLENVPLLDLLPGWTWFVWTTIRKERAKEAFTSNNEQPEGSLAFGEL